MDLTEKHWELIQSVNKSSSLNEYIRRYEFLRGWRQGLVDMGYCDSVGHLIIEGDNLQMEWGKDEDMCGGILNSVHSYLVDHPLVNTSS